MTQHVAPEDSLKMTDLVIRQVTKADLPALEWDGEYTKFRRMYADLFHNARSGRILMWIITSPQSEIIGQVFVMLKSVERDAADGETRAYVFAFRVKPKWRNHGFGQFLMRFVEDDLRQRGYQYITLNVAQDNPDAKRLYQRLGYRVVGSRAGVWSFKDHLGKIQHVNEPSWRMMKKLSED